MPTIWIELEGFVSCCQIHSFLIFLQHFFKSTTTQRHSRLQDWYCVGVNAPKRYRQLWVKDLSKVPTWWLEWHSNPATFTKTQGTELTTEPPRPTIRLFPDYILQLPRAVWSVPSTNLRVCFWTSPLCLSNKGNGSYYNFHLKGATITSILWHTEIVLLSPLVKTMFML